MKTRAWMFVAAALALAACSKKQGDAARCKEVAGGAVDRMIASVAGTALPDDAKAEMKTRADKLKDVMTKRCTEDHWPSEVLDCYAKASSMPEIRACREKLPDDQAQRLRNEEMQAMAMGGAAPRMNPEELQKRLDDLNAQLEKAQQDLSNAQDDAARSAAKDRVVQLQRQQFMLQRRLDMAKGGHPLGMQGSGSAAAAPAPAPAPAGSGSAGSATP